MTTPGESIIAFLQSENVTVWDVVKCQHFQSAFRNSVPELLDFLFSNEIMKQLLDFLLTTTHFTDSNFKQLTVPLTQIMTCQIESVRHRNIENEEICRYLNDFVNPKNSQNNLNSKVSGYFARIVKYLVISTTGQYIEKTPGLFAFLCENISILSYAKLLKSLLRKYYQNFEKVSFPLTEMIDNIIEQCEVNTENAFFGFAILKSLLKKQKYVDKFLSAIATPSHIAKLMKIASGNNGRLSVSIAALEVARTAIDHIRIFLLSHENTSSETKVDADIESKINNKENETETENHKETENEITNKKDNENESINGNEKDSEIINEKDNEQEKDNENESIHGNEKENEKSIDTNKVEDDKNEKQIENTENNKDESQQNENKNVRGVHPFSTPEIPKIDFKNLQSNQLPEVSKNFHYNDTSQNPNSTMSQNHSDSYPHQISRHNSPRITFNPLCVQYKEALRVVDDFEDKFDFIDSPLDFRQACLLKIYSKRTFKLFPSFLRGETSTFVSNAILECVKDMEDEELVKLIEETKMLDSVMHCKTLTKANGHITELIKTLNERSPESIPQLNSEEWHLYKNDVFLPHIKKVTTLYGGSYPNKFATDTDSEDDFGYIGTPRPDTTIANIKAIIEKSKSGDYTRSQINTRCDENDYSYSGSGSYSDDNDDGISPEEEEGNEIQTIPSISNENPNMNCNMKIEKETHLENNADQCYENDAKGVSSENESKFPKNDEKKVENSDFADDNNSCFPKTFSRNYTKIISSSDSRINDDDEKNDDLEIDIDGAEQDQLPKKSMSWDPRFCGPNWNNPNFSCNDDGQSQTSPLTKQTKKFESFDNFEYIPRHFGLGETSSVNNEKLNNDKIPSFGAGGVIQMPRIQRRGTRRHDGGMASLADLPANLRQRHSNT